MNKAILLIGGNLGDRTGHLREAVEQIDKQVGRVEKQSSLYETAAWGVAGQPDYLNQALLVSTEMDARTLLNTVLAIEHNIGRVRRQKWGARVIDIDVIFFNDAVINEPDLKIPHPQMQFRQFVLVPLMEILPDWEHPVLHQSVSTLLANCTDQLPASKYTGIS
ncbi:2-amino-4-hydroxy-6-hydroxymethyldihydropteridine diphosphokinase [Chitinophaga pinensis]|uniref:2-amino-4-hydroxy-6-hydroxymethyldihydropteridine pyrophosphokinase n=1 Tax=Chitinophaga pinensis (strain ATCC 43595 / DSM 2588 / LMG 13176 / NBRC 15968 / NCIMB 11800 / UQM 2034) TaxID=485918 RepID=A0A979GYM8_CHIPD|nr:2-amino-4-hydroxy-6-hydroxymethyldihydropteridine diphosphokinase [Chitinophaga pinensis]ACU63261.1 2-amino-4-hydroxy-6-hydroxymethyldihydropteridin epyrophosphokinase [Chitinophaga pinensis DSM 2588]